MRSVLVTRPQPVADEFAEKLRHEGYTAYVAPMMEYVGIAVDLADLADYQALIFTSAQAVQIFSTLSAERSQLVLAVGDATAATAAKAGFTDVHSAKGNSGDVATLVKTEAPLSGLKKILHLCSADTSDDIGAAVAGAGVEVVRRPVYKTQLADSIPEDVVAALQRGAIDTVMVFSTRTAENFVRLFMQKGLRDMSPKLEVICISDAVAGTLRELPWRSVLVARQPRLEAVMQALRDQGAAQERRQKTERRQKPAYHDRHGHVDSDAYAGPERRIVSRRAHEHRQQKRIWHEKVKFMNRSMLTFFFMFIAIVLAGVFLMAPEYTNLNHKPAGRSHPARRAQEASTDHSIGGMLSRFIEDLQGAADPVSDVVNQVASSAADLVMNPGSGDFSQVLSNIASMRQQAGGDAAVSQSIDKLRAQLSSPDVHSPADVDRVVGEARSNDKTLDNMFGSLKKEDVEAGAMLLVLNEFRSDVNNNRPYADDLSLLRKFTGEDPRMNRALQRLAPYAQSGVMNRQALQAELTGLGGDIVTAQLQGQDISVQDAAKKRLERLERAGNTGDIKGATPDAVVARAQVMLDKGDVKGAMRELEQLNGPAATAAQPFMENATGYEVADRSSDDLTEGLLQTVSSAGTDSAQDLLGMLKDSLGQAVPYISPALTRGGNGGAGIVAPDSGAFPPAP
jgi:uroporphyrinogen-III synthase